MMMKDILFVLDRDIHFRQYKTTDNKTAFSISIDKPSVLICGEKSLEIALEVALRECKRYEKENSRAPSETEKND